jgi:transketolase
MTPTKREVITSNITPFTLGKAQVMKEGRKLTIIACGQMVFESLKASESFGEDVEVINVHTIKPLDIETIIRSVKKTGKVLTVEEHSVIGGLGSAVCEALAEEMLVKVTRLGMKDSFGESGEVNELMKKYGLDAEGIEKEIRRLI